MLPTAREELPGKGLVTDNYLIRNIIPWVIPNISDANFWRSVGRMQPVVVDCLTTLTMYLQSLPWDIRPKEADKQDKYQKDIKRYKQIFNTANDGAGILNFIELFVSDFYLTSFGVGTEAVGGIDNLAGIRRLDAATMFPNPDPANLFYVYQKVNQQTVMFTKDELVRSYFGARPEISRWGWGMGIPEKIYLVIDLLSRGDKYYANLLLDTPEAGILDLGNMSKESAVTWINSFRNLMTGIDGFKVPVLYEHDGEAKYIPFGKPPHDIMFDQVTYKYAALTCAAFGITPADISLKGNQSGGGLSQGMRDERHSKSTGFASLRTVFSYHMNRFLPDYLEYKIVDTDDELLVAKGRARSANAVAGRNFAEGGIFSPQEWRKQMKADALVTIPIDDEQPEPGEFDIIKDVSGLNEQLAIQKKQVQIQADAAKAQKDGEGGAFHQIKGQGGKGLNKQRNVRGGKLEQVQGKDNVPASAGGQGEIKRSNSTDVVVDNLQTVIQSDFQKILDKLSEPKAKRLVRIAYNKIKNTLKSAIVENNDFIVWRANYVNYLFGLENELAQMPLVTKAIDDTVESMTDAVKKDGWWKSNLDDTETGDFLIAAYAAGLKYASDEIQRALYERDLASSENTYLTFDIKDDNIRNGLYNRAEVLRGLIDTGTEFYITRLASASVAQVMDDFKSVLVENTDGLLDNEVFLSRAANQFMRDFEEVLNARLQMISDFEVQKAYNAGILRQYRSVGFQTKSLMHLGADEPCEACKAEEARGFIGIDETFKSKMGDEVQEAPLHPNCHHITIYNKKELSDIKPDYFTG